MRRRLLTVLLCALLTGAPGVPANAAGPGTAAPVVPAAALSTAAGPAAVLSTAAGPAAVLSTAAGPAAAVPAGDGAYGWPLPGWPRVGRAFDPPSSTYGAGHRGVDLVAVAGTPVLAAGAGTVVFAGPLAGRGVVSVQHADGLRTTYEPVTASVVAGAHVDRGTVLGVLEAGHPGCPGPACLHWGVRRGTADYLDPLRLLGRWEVRLLPWEG